MQSPTQLARLGSVFAIHAVSVFLLPFHPHAMAGRPDPVQFDAPAIVVAEPISADVIGQPTTGGELIRVKIPVSTFIAPTFQGSISEFVVEIVSSQQSLRVVDFWPKNEVYSEIDGNIAVEDNRQKAQHFAFNVSGAYEPFGRGSAIGDFEAHQDIEQRYQRRPPMQLLTSSGTIERGFGVFYKFRPGNVPVLEGDREVALLVEAPRGWRGDLLQIAMHAVGSTRDAMGNARPQHLGSARMWTAIHYAGDEQAAEAAKQFVARDRALRSVAGSSQRQIEERSLPTVFHKVGAALDMVEPRIPSDYLTQILFGNDPQYFDSATSRLPVDLRVAALDYWDQRSRLLSLASR